MAILLATTDALTRKIWDTILHRQVQNKLYWRTHGLVGRDIGEEGDLIEDKPWLPIVEKSQFNKERGDRITMNLIRKLTGSGQTGITALVDSEESLGLWRMQCYIELKRHGVLIDGFDMSQQRAVIDLDAVATRVLSDWYAQLLDDEIFNAFYNGFSANVIAQSVAATTTMPTANLIFAGTAPTAEAVGPMDKMSCAVIDKCRVFADVNNIVPVMYKGESCYVMIVHTYQMNDLRQDDRWERAAHHAAPRGDDNPLWNHAEGKWNGVFIHQSNKIAVEATTVTDYLNKRRAIFTGAHAVAMGVAMEPEMRRRKEDDYGIKKGYGLQGIYGTARADWTDGTNTSNQSAALVTTFAKDPLATG